MRREEREIEWVRSHTARSWCRRGRRSEEEGRMRKSGGGAEEEEADRGVMTGEDCREKVIRREQRDGRRKEKVRLEGHEGG